MPELHVIDPSSGEEVGRLPSSDADRLVETARADTRPGPAPPPATGLRP